MERPFTDTDTNSLPEHKLAFQKLIPPISSPQIFHGLRFIPGGADGLEQYFAKLRGADEKSVHIYGNMLCPACRAAKEAFGDHAHFVSIVKEGTWEPLDDIQLHPDHKTQLTADEQEAILHAIRTTETVPVIYRGAEKITSW